MPDFPKLLVATEFSPNSSGGGGAIIRQMLKGWPAEKLFWWSCWPDTDQRFGQGVAAQAVAVLPRRLYPNRRWCSQKSWFLENLWAPHAARHLEKTLDKVQPEVVWVIPHGWSIPALARVLPHRGTGFHVSVHDYMDIAVYSSRFGHDRCLRMARCTEYLYAAATTRDAIGLSMLEDLRARTGREGTITRAGLEAEDFAFLENPPQTPSGPLRIGYAGSIQVEGVFHTFVAALEKIRHRLPRPLTLEFFGANAFRTRPWFDPSWMTERGNLPLPQLSAALKQCTWGFSPMDLTDADPRYNRFSLPTKFISYLSAGLPVITLGHPESSIVKMAMTYDVGVCLTTLDRSALAVQLLATLTEPVPGIRFRPTLRHCAAEEFDAAKMRAALHENLQKCAANARVARPFGPAKP